MILGITGYAQSGKDSLAWVLKLRHGFERAAFADKLKELALRLDPVILHSSVGSNDYLSDIVATHGWDTAKNEWPTVREYLQRLGTEVRETLGIDVWVNAVRPAIMNALQQGKNVAITDVRFPNEVAFVHQLNGFVIRVQRPGVQPINDHISDTGIDALEADFTIYNDGTLTDLGRRATNIYESIKQMYQ